MSNLFFIFFRRNFRLFVKIFLLSFLIILFPSVFSIGTASFERISVYSTLSETDVDFEIQGKLIQSYASNNLSFLSSSFEEWKNDIVDLEKYMFTRGFILFTSDSTRNETKLIGIDLFIESKNKKKSTISSNITTVFGKEINIEEFSISDYLPFNLDLIISLSTFSSYQNLSYLFSNAKIGYYTDFSTKLLPSFTKLDDVIRTLTYLFRSFFIQNEIVRSGSILSIFPDTSEIHSFKQPFDSIVLLVSLISILSVVWLIEIFTGNFLNQINSQVEIYSQRGLSSKRKRILQVVLPIIIDTLALVILCLVFWCISFIFSLNLLYVFIISPLAYLILIYRRIKHNKELSVHVEKSKTPFIKYILAFIIISLLLLVITRVFNVLLPMWLNSLILSVFTIIQYYIVTLILTELLLSLIKFQSSKKKKLTALINKVLFSKRTQLSSWFHSFLLLMWSLTIITSSIHSFDANFMIEYNLSNLSDVKIDVSLSLSNVSLISALPEVQSVLPISYSEEYYFQPYDLYLVDLDLMYEFYPDIFHLIDSFIRNTSSTYISEDMAQEFNFNESDLFPTKFGHNITNIIVNQPIIITKYFPLIKSIENRPFVAASYRYEFANFTQVDQLLVDFKENITLNQGIEAIEKVLGSNFQIRKNYPIFSYDIAFLIYQYAFLILSMFLIGINFSHFIKSLNPIYAQFSARGMQQKKIKSLFIKQSLPLLVYPFLLSMIIGAMFIFLQMPKMIYQINLYVPVQVKIGFAISLVLLLPVICLLISFIALNLKFRNLSQSK